MIRFLVKHPVSVIMSFLLCFILGIVAYTSLPVSLLPEIAIPELSVRIEAQGKSAREIEDEAVNPLRTSLLQVRGLADINSLARDDYAYIRLRLNYGVNTDLALIEVNEKVDAAMGALGNRVKRPVVLKENASDIPVFYLNISLKEAADESKFAELSDLVTEVILHRIEQLPSVALTDATGLVSKELQIVPDRQKLIAHAFSLDDIERALKESNMPLGQMQIEDRQLAYKVKLNNRLASIDELRSLYVKNQNSFIPLEQLAEIRQLTSTPKGYSLINGRRAISIALIKQGKASMKDMRQGLASLITELEHEYPSISLEINRDETELLDYSVGNLKSSLFIGFILICLLTLLFMGELRASLVIGINMIVALVCSLFFFYIFGRTLNIISLSGLILALGLMIDNSIVVTDTIAFYRRAGLSSEDASVRGTNEVITPLLSSGLTTVAIFIPLVFLSGIVGVLFTDEAFSICIGLFSSYITAIILLPVNYKQFYPDHYKENKHSALARLKEKLNVALNRFYLGGFNFFARRKALPLLIFVLAIPLCTLFFLLIPKKQMPSVPHTTLTVRIDWGEAISAKLNRERSQELLALVQDNLSQGAAYAGEQQFLLNSNEDVSDSETLLYLKANNEASIKRAETELKQLLASKYGQTQIHTEPSASIFDRIFSTNEPELLARFYPSSTEELTLGKAEELKQRIERTTGQRSKELLTSEEIVLSIDKRLINLYGVELKAIKQSLQTAFNRNEVIELKTNKEQIPVLLSDESKSLNEILQRTFVKGYSPDHRSQSDLPLSALISQRKSRTFKEIHGGKNGEYLPMLYDKTNDAAAIIKESRAIIDQEKAWSADFTGAFFSNKKMIRELGLVMLLSIFLMYFILAAQFESLLQPLIVLMEIPIDIALTLLVLLLTGNTLNLMSAIGLVVACGIVINDSVLKLDMINRLRRRGVPLYDAIHQAGDRRLRSIIMTSLTTILALVPTLFAFDFGSSLQKPLAISLISAMFFGTLISLFVIPHIYAFIYRKHKQTPAHEQNNS